MEREDEGTAVEEEDAEATEPGVGCVWVVGYGGVFGYQYLFYCGGALRCADEDIHI